MLSTLGLFSIFGLRKNRKKINNRMKKSTPKVYSFYFQKIGFLKIFSFAQNRFQIFDVDISTFVACEKPVKNSKNAICG